LIAVVAGVVIVLGVLVAIVDQAMMSADGDHPTPAVRDPPNAGAPAPSQ
jgi:hypothetical protein